MKGTEGAQADPAGSVDIMKKDSEYKPKQVDIMVPATLPALTPPSGAPILCMDLTGWQAFGKWMADNKLLKAPIDATTIATDDYLPNAC